MIISICNENYLERGLVLNKQYVAFIAHTSVRGGIGIGILWGDTLYARHGTYSSAKGTRPPVVQSNSTASATYINTDIGQWATRHADQ